MQTKMTLRIYLTPVRIAKIKNTAIAHTGKDVEQKEVQTSIPSLEVSVTVFRKLGINLPQIPAILLLDINRKNIPPSPKNTCSTIFIVTLFVIAS